jgi:hypothetical protein
MVHDLRCRRHGIAWCTNTRPSRFLGRLGVRKGQPQIRRPFNRATTSLWACSLLETVLRYDLRNEIVPVVRHGQIMRAIIVSLRADLLLISFLVLAAGSQLY